MRFLAILLILLIFPLKSFSQELDQINLAELSKDENLKSFDIYYKKIPVSKIDSYSYYYGYYFDILKLLRVLEIKYDSNPIDRILTIKTPKGDIDFTEDKINFFYINDKAYLKETLLSKLNIDIKYDINNQKIIIDKYEILEKKYQKSDAKIYKEIIENPDEDLIAFAVIKIGEYSYDELVDVYEITPENYYVSLNQLSSALDFALEFDEITARGWYIKSQNNLFIDFANLKMKNKGIESEISRKDFFIYDSEFFIHKDLLENIFPLILIYRVNAGLLVINPLQKLPFQIERERELKREKWLNMTKKQNLPLIENKYKLATKPIIDASLNNSYNKETKDFTNNFTLNSSSDLGYVSQYSSLTGNRKELDSFQINLIKDFEENKIIKNIQFGDINSDSLDLVSSGRFGRGIKIGNNEKDLISNFDAIDIVGNSEPNWEVELYKNNIFLDFVDTDGSGRYEFRQVPLNYGENNIKLVFYGPRGEIKEETRSYNIDSSILREGEFKYSTSIIEKQTELLDIKNEKTQDYFTSFISSYGLNNSNTMNFNLGQDEVNDQIKNYAGIGLSTLFSDSVLYNYISFDLDNNEFATTTSYYDTIFNQNINLRFNYIKKDYISEDFKEATNKLKYSSDFDLVGNINLFKTKNINYSLKNNYISNYDKSTQYNLTSSMSSYLMGVLFSKEILYTHNRLSDGSDSEDMDLNLSMRRKIFDSFFRADMNFDILPEEQFKTISISNKRDLYKDFDGNFSISYDNTNHIRKYSADLIYDAKKYLLSTGLSGDSESNLTISLNISFSLYPDVRDDHYNFSSSYLSNSGGISAAGFLDENYNNIKDDNEEYIEEVNFLQNNRIMSNDKKKNYATISGLNSNSYSNISINQNSLTDPYQITANEGYRIKTRRGVIKKIDLPIINSSEIDGTIYFENIMIPGLKLTLLDKEGRTVSQTKTESDGYYIFENIKKGEYYLSIDETDLEKIGAKYSIEIINIDDSENKTKDIKLEKLTELTISH